MSRRPARCAAWVLAFLLAAGSGTLRPGEDGRAPSAAPSIADRTPIHVCLSPDGASAFVVNQTADTIAVLDVRSHRVVRELPVGSHPAHAVPSPDGSRLYVTAEWAQAVQVVDLASGAVVATRPAGLSPFGAAPSPTDGRLWVADAIGDAALGVDHEGTRPTLSAETGLQPKYVTVTPDGARVLVSGGLSRGIGILDARTGALLETRALGRASILRQIACSPDGRWAFVAHLVARDDQMTLQMDRGWICSNGFSILDLDRPGHYVTLLLDRLMDGAANPWGVAVSPDGQRLWVTLSGVHEVAIVNLPAALELAAEATTPAQVKALAEDVEVLERRGIARRVPCGGLVPRGLAFSAATGELWVANAFSDSVSVLDAETGAVRAVIPLGDAHAPTLQRQGELLFNDARICYQRWMSCVSCHQEDATVDGLNWDLANDGLGNPKNAKSLHDAADTPPSMWTGVRKDMDAAVAAGQRFFGFLPEPGNHSALKAFLTTARRAPNPFRGREPEAERRGAEIFGRARCATCHPPPAYTDLSMHDLGLSREVDLVTRIDTPSLRDCYRGAPYLHDGRARTLREIFTQHNPDNHHGETSHLTGQELHDLIAYLRSL